MQPHRAATFKLSTDPLLAEKVRDIVGLYLLPPDRALCRGVHRSVADLERHIRAFIEAINADPRPFRRVKSADNILASVRRSCLRTLDTTSNPPLPQTSEPGHWGNFDLVELAPVLCSAYRPPACLRRAVPTKSKPPWRPSACISSERCRPG